MSILPVALALILVAGLESDPELKQGQDLVDAFEVEQAAAVFERISKRPGLSNEDRATALVWLGLALAEARDPAKASVAFEEAVSADPLIVLPRDASPKIKNLLEEARARVRARPRPKVEAAQVPPPPPPTQTSGAEAPANSAPVPEAPGSILLPIAVGTTIAGGVIGLAGGALWGFGLALHEQAVDEPFQSEAAELNNQSVASQLGGQVATGVGVAALAVGGVLIGLSVAE